MDYKTYQQRVLARASHRWYDDKVDVDDIHEIVGNFIMWGNRLDRVKKSLMYGRDFVFDVGMEPFPVAKTLGSVTEQEQRVLHAILGLATEGVELIEAAQGFLFNGKDFDLVNLQEEFGDAEWYRALFLDAVGQTHEQNIEQNDAKLEKRFGSTFTEDKANSRDLTAEREVLEDDRSSNDPLKGYGGHYGY